MLNVEDIINTIHSIEFGEVAISAKEKSIYELLNSRIPHLCKSLPPHMQNKAMLFMMDYSNTKIGGQLDFSKNFYKPVWTIIPAISESKS